MLDAVTLMVDDREVHHGELNCQWNGRQKFKCQHCRRWVCYCGGHDNSTPDCRVLCDTCCTC